MMNKLMKKLAVVFTAATMAITATGVITQANDGMGMDAMGVTVNDCSGEAYVITSTANVRTAPTTASRVLVTLGYGDEVYFEGYTSNGWYRVWETDPVYGGTTAGYIYGDLVSMNYVDQDDFIEYYDIDDDNTYYTVTVSVPSGYLALRTTPQWTDDDSNVIEELYSGQTFTVTENAGQYVYGYSNATGAWGYVNADYVY